MAPQSEAVSPGTAQLPGWLIALDSVGALVLVVNLGSGTETWTSALDRLLRDEFEGFRVRRELSDLVRLAAAAPGKPSEGWTSVAGLKCRIRARWFDNAPHGPAVLALLEPEWPARMSSPLMRSRYGLTPREVQVARLLADGCTNAEIARVLQISRHTALRHSERVFDKVGVHSRARLAAMLGGRVRV